MDAILAPERDMKGSLEVKGVVVVGCKAVVCTWPANVLSRTLRDCVLYARRRCGCKR